MSSEGPDPGFWRGKSHRGHRRGRLPRRPTVRHARGARCARARGSLRRPRPARPARRSRGGRRGRGGAPPGRPRGWHRLQPPQPGSARLRQPDDGRERLRGVPLRRVSASSWPRARSAPTRSSRRCRSRRTTSGTAIRRSPTLPTGIAKKMLHRAVGHLPAPVRLRLLRAGARQPLRARATTSTSRTRT